MQSDQIKISCHFANDKILGFVKCFIILRNDSFVAYLPNIGCVQYFILLQNGSVLRICQILGLSNIFPKTKWAGKYNLTYLDPNKTHSVDAISGSCMFIRKTLFHKIGGFDKQFFLFGEDLDLCYRLKQKEHEIHYVPSTQILHYKGESVKFAPYDSISAFYKAMILFYKKHFSKNQNILFRFGIQLGIQFHKIISFITEWRSQILSIFIDSCVVFIAFLIAFILRFSNLDSPFFFCLK